MNKPRIKPLPDGKYLVRAIHTCWYAKYDSLREMARDWICVMAWCAVIPNDET